jgi:ribA/ribD-fused uncharacterized protein
LGGGLAQTSYFNDQLQMDSTNPSAAVLQPTQNRKRTRRGPRNRKTKDRQGTERARVSKAQLRYMTAALAGRDRHQVQCARNGETYKPKPLTIGFFKQLNPYPYSNHAQVRTRYREISYPTSEHAYLTLQARCYGMDRLADIWQKGEGSFFCFNRWFDASNPKHVKSWSTSEFRYFRNHPDDPRRKEWTQTRNNIMFAIVKAKFTGNAQARRILLDSGYAYLAELSPDDHWGVGERMSPEQLERRVAERRVFRGRNQLGQILMAVRETLRRKALCRCTLTVRTARYLAKQALKNARSRRAPPALETQVAQLKKKGLPSLQPNEMHRVMTHFSFQLVPQARQLALSTVKPKPLPPGVRILASARRTHKHLEGQ